MRGSSHGDSVAADKNVDVIKAGSSFLTPTANMNFTIEISQIETFF